MYDINLLPTGLSRKINIDLKRIFILLLAILVPAGLIGAYALFLIDLNQLRLEASKIDQQLEVLAPQANRLEQLRLEKEKSEQQLSTLQSLLDNRFTITPILSSIALNMPVDIWITGITAEYRENYIPLGGFSSPTVTPDFEDTVVQAEQQTMPAPNMLVLQGTSYSPASIAVLVSNLSALPYFQNIDVVKIHTATNGERGLAFHIEARLLGVKQDATQP